MSKMLKHVGQYGGKPCVVVFRQLPDDEDYCLIVLTASLESQQHDDLINVVQSNEGQEANEISQVLHRRQFTDGSNMLSSLHFSKKLSRVQVAQVKLVPFPNQAVELSQVNAELRKIAAGNPPQINEAREQRVTTSNVEKPELPLTPVSVESDPTLAENKVQEVMLNDANIAKNLMVQAALLHEDAKLLAKDADAKIKEAYRLDPTLNILKGKKNATTA